MTVVITPVGTSLFTNDTKSKIRYQQIKDRPEADWDHNSSYISALRKVSKPFIENKKKCASAELQSIAKIRDELKDDKIEVRLLASDTIASRLAAEILMEQGDILGNNVSVKFEAQEDVIRGLQIKNTEDFSNRGMPNLMRRISQLDGQLVINITGGYKATVPYLTILSQVDRIPLFYTFEDMDVDSPDLIRIPQVPLSVDWQLVQYYADVFSEIDKGIQNWAEFEKENDFAINDLRGCIEVADNIADFSWFGKKFWERYQNHYVVRINPESYSTYSKVWHGINTAIENLYTGLNTALSKKSGAFKEPYQAIKDLNNNLNHTGPINEKTFIFKSQKKRLPIRFAYSFEVNDREIISITIFDIQRGDFNHSQYAKTFKEIYKNQSNINNAVTLILPKPSS